MSTDEKTQNQRRTNLFRQGIQEGRPVIEPLRVPLEDLGIRIIRLFLVSDQKGDHVRRVPFPFSGNISAGLRLVIEQWLNLYVLQRDLQLLLSQLIHLVKELPRIWHHTIQENRERAERSL